jgi:hypothetical protein
MWHAWNGNRDAMLAWLTQMADAGMVLRELEFDPVFDSFRSDPEFVRLRETMRRTAAAAREQLDADIACATIR